MLRQSPSGNDNPVTAHERAVIEELRRVYFSTGGDEQDVLRALAPRLRAARFFVDVGASLGQFTEFASRTMLGGRVLSVEADPLRATELEKECLAWQSRSKPRLEVVHAAATDHDGVVRLSVTDSTVSGGLFRHPLEHVPSNVAAAVRWREVDVPARCLDTLCQGDVPDMVKIDVEGAELRVLKGADGILRRGSTHFLVEIHPWADPEGQSSPAEVLAFMASRGYRPYPFVGKTLFAAHIGVAESATLHARHLFDRIRRRLKLAVAGARPPATTPARAQ